MFNRLTIIFLLILSTNCGCLSTLEQREELTFSEYRKEKKAKRAQSDTQQGEINNLWRAGYGYNNPNSDRKRQGLSPQNFDGSVEPRKKDSYLSTLAGDYIAFCVGRSFKSTVSKTAELSRKIQEKVSR